MAAEAIALQPVTDNGAAPAVQPVSTTTTPSPNQACPSCWPKAQVAENGIGTYIYAIGQIVARFPQLSVEKEYAQALGRAETAGLSDTAALQKVLTQPENRYLARELCWTLNIKGLETYFLLPSYRSDFDLLVNSLRPMAQSDDLDVVIGTRGPLAPANMCNGLTIPTLLFDQIYSFDRAALLSAMPRPEDRTPEQFSAAATNLLERMLQIADNTGSADEHRALNYLAVRYPAIYLNTADAFARNASLTRVDTMVSRLSGVRNVVDVVFSYTNRTTDVVEKHFVRVDVTEKYPFLVTRLSQYYDR